MIKRLSKVGWIVLAALLCLVLVVLPACAGPGRRGRGGDNANGGYLDAGYGGPERDGGGFS